MYPLHNMLIPELTCSLCIMVLDLCPAYVFYIWNEMPINNVLPEAGSRGVDCLGTGEFQGFIQNIIPLVLPPAVLAGHERPRGHIAFSLPSITQYLT